MEMIDNSFASMSIPNAFLLTALLNLGKDNRDPELIKQVLFPTPAFTVWGLGIIREEDPTQSVSHASLHWHCSRQINYLTTEGPVILEFQLSNNNDNSKK